MAEHIKCRHCESPDCRGCNIHTLAAALERGYFDSLMDGNRAIHINTDIKHKEGFAMVEVDNEGRLTFKEDLGITQDEAYSLAEFIDCNLISEIRNNAEIDSMQWLRNMIHAYEKLCRYSRYVGLTESGGLRWTDKEQEGVCGDE